MESMDASDWMKGIFFSVLASVIGAASKLAIRKGWLMEQGAAGAEVGGRHELVPTTPSAARDFDSSFHDESEEFWRDTHQHEDEVPPDTISHASSGNPNEPLDLEDDYEHQQQHQQQPSSKQQEKPNSRRLLVYTAVESNGPQAANGGTATSPRMGSSSPHHQPQQQQSSSLSPSRNLHRTGSNVSISNTTNSNISSINHNNNKCLFWTWAQLLRFAGMIGMTFINPACSLVAMNYASPSILAPFSGLTLVWVIVLSRPLINENPTCSQKVASGLIVLGEVMVAVFGDHTNDEDATTSSVINSYKEPAFVLYFIALGCWMGLLLFWIYRPIHDGNPTGTTTTATTTRTGRRRWLSFCRPLVGCCRPLVSCCDGRTLQRFAWGTSGGSVTGLAQCFIKDSLEILKSSPNKWRMPWFEYLFIFLGIYLSFQGLLFLSACMKRYDATYSAAMFVGSFVVSTSIMSTFHYHTFQHLADLTDIIMYPLGLVILMIGVAILVQRGSTQHEQPGGVRGEEGPNMMPPLPEPRMNRAYSDVYRQEDIPLEHDSTPVIVIPEVIPETTLTERSNTVGSVNNSRDELELI